MEEEFMDKQPKLKEKKPFLKRGEGVQRRVHGSQIASQKRKDEVAADGYSDRQYGWSQSERISSPDVKPMHDQARGQRKPQTNATAAYPHECENKSRIYDEDRASYELQAETKHMPVQSIHDTWTGYSAHNATAHQDDDLDLAEFEALENQIRKDLGAANHAVASKDVSHKPASFQPQPSGRSYGHVTKQQGYPSFQDDTDSWDQGTAQQQLNSKDVEYAQPTSDSTWQDVRSSFAWPAIPPQQQHSNAHLSSAWGASEGHRSTRDRNRAHPIQAEHFEGLQAGPSDAWLAEDDDDVAAEPSTVRPAGGFRHDRQGGQYDDWEQTPPASTNNRWHANNPQQTRNQHSDYAAAVPSDSQPKTQGSGSPALEQPFVRSLFSGVQQPGSVGEKSSGGKHAARRPAGGRGTPDSAATAGPNGAGNSTAGSDLSEQHQKLQAEMNRLQQERASLLRLRTELEKTAMKLETEKLALEKKQAQSETTFEAWRAAETAKLERERRVLDKQSKALLKLPNRKERSAVEAIEAVLEEERREARAAAARHKLAAERLRRQLLEQQEKNRELREEIRWHEAQKLNLEFQGSKRSPGGSTAKQPPSPAMVHAAVQVDIGESTLANAALQAAASVLLPHLQPQQKPAQPNVAKATAPPRSVSPAIPTQTKQNPSSTTAKVNQPPSETGSKCHAMPFKVPTRQHERQSSVTSTDGPLSQVPKSPRSTLSQYSDTSHRSGYEASEWSTDAAELQELGNTLRLLRVEREQEQHISHQEDAREPHQRHTTHGFGRGGSNEVLASIDINSRQPHASQGETRHRPGGGDENSNPHQDHNELHHGLDQKTKLQPPQVASNIGKQPPSQQQQVDNADARQSRQQSTGKSSKEDAIVRQVQHPDGKREKLYASGRKDVWFSNGTRKTVLADGTTLIKFCNGDIKHQLPDGSTQYYYAEVGTWQTTQPGGTEVFHFPSGQVEAHIQGPYSVREVLFPDGAARRVWPTGEEEDVPCHLLSSAVRLPCPHSLLSDIRE